MGALHQVLGESFRSLDLGGCLRRAEKRNPPLGKGIAQSLGQGRFRAAHHEINAFALGQRQQISHRLGTHRRQGDLASARPLAAAKGLDAGVAWRSHQVSAKRALQQLPGQGVLAPA